MMSRTPERQQFIDDNARLARIASKHVLPQHIEPVLDHLAASYDKAMQDGTLTLARWAHESLDQMVVALADADLRETAIAVVRLGDRRGCQAAA
jgi:hypothetical protein